MDLATDDQRAWHLAPHLVLLDRESDLAWLNPETGTTCVLEPDGDYVVLRRNGERYAPVVAGQLASADAHTLRSDPDGVLTRRAVAHAIVAVDATAR